MALAEKLEQKLEKKVTELGKKSKETEVGKGADLSSISWLTLILISVFIDIIFVLLAVVGLIPFIGQPIYAIADPALNLLVTISFWLYLQHKGLGGYWWMAFGDGLANFVPVVNWFGWTLAVLILYVLVKAAEKVPLAGEAIGKVAQAASKVK